MLTQSQWNASRLYLTMLAKSYPNARAAAAEIINLRAILNLPKGTEHYISDIHGEYEAFRHILNNGSGVIREKIDMLFGTTLSEEERADLATLIYYPQIKLKEMAGEGDTGASYRRILQQLIAVCRLVSSKYTRSKVRKALPSEFAYILEELMTEDSTGHHNRVEYHDNILDSILELGQGEAMILDLTHTIKRLIVDKLHVVGDIFDRGPRPDKVLDDLMEHHNADVQWGNHDVLWMGAACGSRVCIANALNNCFTYGNLDTIEVGYGISLRPLALLAADVYGMSDITNYLPKEDGDTAHYAANSPQLVAGMHKAIATILFKLEGHVIRRNPSFGMDDRLLLDKIDYRAGTVTLDGVTYPLKDRHFPTVSPDDPYRLTGAEEQVMEQLKTAFRRSEKLQRHVSFLFSHGGLYRCCNNNLLIHGCVPMNEDGSFLAMEVDGRKVAGRELLDAIEQTIRRGYAAGWNAEEWQTCKDLLWFLWCGRHSPLFGRSHIRTFERLLVADALTHEELLNPYYTLYHDEAACQRVLREFGLDPVHGHIINGHIPVRRSRGESPIKAGGRLIVIDGGICHAYQKKTGTAGYTLIYNSYGMRIVAHEEFEGIANVVAGRKDVLSSSVVFEVADDRIRVSTTEDGAAIRERIEGLTLLLDAYRTGRLKESFLPG